jgi:hypothetical protein
MNEIVSETRTVRYRPYRYATTGDFAQGEQQTGMDLRMRDGSLWFHPFSGADPRMIEPAAERG